MFEHEHFLISALRKAEVAITHAQNVREYHRFRTPVGSPQREADILEALTKIRTAMEPLRFFYTKHVLHQMYQDNPELEAQLRKASKAMKYERVQLWKMQDTKKRKPKKPPKPKQYVPRPKVQRIRHRDMVGEVFGDYTVIERAGTTPHNKEAVWLCECICGTRKIERGSRLRSGSVWNCGCVQNRHPKQKIKHKKFKLEENADVRTQS